MMMVGTTLPDFTLTMLATILLCGITMCMMATVALFATHDRDVAITLLPLTLAMVGASLWALGHDELGIVILGLFGLARLRGLIVKRWGDYTLGCLLFRQHEWCDQHLTCGCPHHDEVIMQEMTR